MFKRKFLPSFVIPESYDQSFDAILIDKRYASRYADVVLGKNINIEFIARECSDRAVRTAFSAVLNTEILGAAFLAIHSARMVELDKPIFTRTGVLSEVATQLETSGITGPIDRVAVIATDVLLHILRPLGIVDETASECAVLTDHWKLFPNYNDIMIDVWTREIEKSLTEARRLDVGSGKTKLGANVVADRIASVARTLRRCVEYVGDYAAYADDALTLVHMHLLPRNARSAHSQFVPEDLVDHPTIRAMAANHTVARIAISRAGATADRAGPILKTTAFLAERLNQVASFFFESKRYARVSLRDFMNYWTKSTYTADIDNKVVGGTLSFNVRGANSAQAVVSEASLMYAKTRFIEERQNATKVLSAHYGSLMNRFDSASAHELVDITTGIRISSYETQSVDSEDSYLNLMMDTLSEEDRAIAIEALAIALMVMNGGKIGLADLNTSTISGGADGEQTDEGARAREVSRALNDANQCFIYSFEAKHYHMPVSGIRDHERFRLIDPAEVILLQPDWKGTVFLTDKVQVVPETVLSQRILGEPDLGLSPVRGFANFKLNLSNVELSGGFQFVGSAISLADRDAMVVRPLLNSAVVTQSLAVVKSLLDETRQIDDNVITLQIKRHIMTFLLQAADQGVGEQVIAVYVRALGDQCLSGVKQRARDAGPGNDSVQLTALRRASALLREPAFKRAATLFVFEQILNLLSLVPAQTTEKGRSTAFFDAIRDDEQFTLMLGS